MKKFLKFRVGLNGANESDLTEDFVAKLNKACEEQKGIFAEMFGSNADLFVQNDTKTLILQGELTAATRKECKALFTMFKAEAKRVFPTCKKVEELIVAEGDKLW